ncbi:MAG: hypothetical protein M4579_002861 [Chaenotheca gracillima]|nr:MAG: hypothetical protein M4579_002861 [Chaenotheca gracillima]
MSAYGVSRAPRQLKSLLPAVNSISSRRFLSGDPTGRAQHTPLTSVLIANRGEIALRVARTASEYGIRTTTVYTDPDANSQHALASPFTHNLGEPSAYLDGDRILEIAKREGCKSIHPGYGFLSENPSFARKCNEAGVIFIGPPWKAIEAMGSKSESKNIMNAAGVPCVPGYHGSNQDPEFLEAEAEKIGFPVLLKAVKGGGGKGMRIAQHAGEFQEQLKSAQSEARNSFGDDVMLVEKYITTPRHIEVQVFADKHGNCVALGERDCSIQRRHQKILEESPAPHLQQDIRYDLWAKARAAALAVGYEGAGTVEFIFDNDSGEFFFMEMNTRLQVEHPVTEMVTGQDLVHWQFVVAEGGKLPLTQDEVEAEINARGAAVEARIYAENPDMNFIPDSGRLIHLKTPTPTSTVRIDAGFIQGDEVSSHYDPMIAKLIVRGPTRQAALLKLEAALAEYEVVGPTTNINFLKTICRHPAFMSGEVETGFIPKYHDELFAPIRTESEVFAQAALALLLREVRQQEQSTGSAKAGPSGSLVGFGLGQFQERQVTLAVAPFNGDQKSPTPQNVTITQTAPSNFKVSVDDTAHYANVITKIVDTGSSTSTQITTFFPHTRITSTVVSDPTQNEYISVFQRGQQHRLRLIPPAWFKKALDVKEVTNSVLAPMPCKVLRVEVAEGDAVQKDQPLVVIESMKMETVVRSPMEGIVKKVVHREGDLCKAGTALVEFEENAES